MNLLRRLPTGCALYCLFGNCRFETVSLLDDLQDHWDSAVHLKERNALIHRLQEHARAHGRRVSFISGDVHCAQVGRLYTSPKVSRRPCFHRTLCLPPRGHCCTWVFAAFAINPRMRRVPKRAGADIPPSSQIEASDSVCKASLI